MSRLLKKYETNSFMVKAPVKGIYAQASPEH